VDVIPTRQTIFGYPHGNCFQACVASITDTPLEEVPHFCDGENENWWSDTKKWCEQNGLVVVNFEWNINLLPTLEAIDDHYIVSGPSPRGNWLHSVVGYKGKCVHDPHPDDAMLAGDPVDIMLIVKTSRAQFLEDGRFQLLAEAA
jgi:hypothetical protein